MFEVFEHTADLGLRISSQTLAGLFVDAARGLFSIIAPNLDEVQRVHTKSYQLAADANDFLLFDWLNELLFTFESEKLLLSQFDVVIDEAGLRATAHGEPMDLGRHEMAHEVKAITYHGLRVEQDESGWIAEVIVDI